MLYTQNIWRIIGIAGGGDIWHSRYLEPQASVNRAKNLREIVLLKLMMGERYYSLAQVPYSGTFKPDHFFSEDFCSLLLAALH